MLNYIKLTALILWQLPQNLVALIMMPFLGTLNLIKKENYTWIFEATNMRGGISLGNFIFISTSYKQKETVILHELGHVKQSHILGFLYLFVIGIPSVLNACFGFTKCYYDWYTEKWANSLMNLEVSKNQYGYFLYQKKQK